MATNSSRIAQQLLESFNNVPNATQAINQLLEKLENKIDPDPIEIRLVQNLYHFLEKLKILEHNLNSYIKDTNKGLIGNKLSSLYENKESFGTSKLF